MKLVLATLNNSDGMYTGFVGVLGQGALSLPLWSVVVLYIVIFLSFGVDAKALKLDKARAVCFWLAAAVCLLGILIAEFIYWTPLGQGFIGDVQGRYFLPIVIATTPALIGRYRHTISWTKIYAGSLAMLLVTVWVLGKAFYV